MLELLLFGCPAAGTPPVLGWGEFIIYESGWETGSSHLEVEAANIQILGFPDFLAATLQAQDPVTAKRTHSQNSASRVSDAEMR